MEKVGQNKFYPQQGWLGWGKQLELGLRTYFSAIGFVFSKGLWWTFFIPVILNIILFVGGYALIESLTKFLHEWLLNFSGLKEGNFFLSGYLTGFFSVIIWLFLNVLFFFVLAYWGGYITLLVLSPLLSYLSERTEEIISGKQYSFSTSQFIRGVIRGVLIAVRNLFIETVWMILLFIIGFIPVIGWFGAIVLFIISAYFYGFSFIDYTSERRRMSIRESVRLVRKYKWLSVANGAVFCFFLFIPFCGVLFSGFAAIISVVAATLAVNEIKKVLPKK